MNRAWSRLTSVSKLLTRRPTVSARVPSLSTSTVSSFSTSSSANSYKVLGVQQIAVGGLEKAPLTHLWTELFGVEKVKSFTSEKENVDEDVLVLGKGPHAIEIDLMAPLDPNRSPKVHIPPLNHIGLWVDNIEAAVAGLTEKGVRFAPGGIRPGASGHKVAFIHPKGNAELPYSGCGVLIELVQAPEDVIAALS